MKYGISWGMRVIFAAILMLCFAVPVTAQAPTIKFKEFSLTRKGEKILLKYEVAGPHWRRLSRSGATIKVRAHDQSSRGPITTKKVRLAKKDRLLLPGAKRVGGDVVITVSFSMKKSPIVATFNGLGPFAKLETRSSQLQVTSPVAPPGVHPITPVTPPPQPQRRPWASLPNVHAACRDTFEGDKNEQACLQLANRSFRDPTLMITECGTLADGDNNELACVEAAVFTRNDFTGVISACGKAFDGDANEVACVSVMAKAAPGTSGLVAVINQCERSFSGDEAELRCLSTSVRH